jgi:RNA polymerase sigma-70 factor (ECF subfamily)
MKRCDTGFPFQTASAHDDPAKRQRPTERHERPRSEDGRAAGGSDSELVARLRAGEEEAFSALLQRHSRAMLRLASVNLPRATAEEVVQDTWLAVLQGIDQFEGRSSLKTWIFSILMNRTKTRMQRDGRTVPFSALLEVGEGSGEPSVDPNRFLDSNHPQWPRHWASPPKSWGHSPEDRLLAHEAQAVIQGAIDALPPGQRQVIVLTDVDGWEPAEVCELLGITGTNQRVLLHRARSKVRRACEHYFEREA